MSKNVRSRVQKKTMTSSPKKSRLFQWHATMKGKIIDFLKRGDNSTCLPGMRDSKKVGDQQLQKYILNDYLENLHIKFLAENPTVHLSYSTFTRMRPKEIIPVSYSSRQTCLCEKHQNFSLKLVPLKNMQLINTVNPDVFRKSYTTDEKLDEVLHKIDTGDKVQSVEKDLFCEHAARAKEQYEQIKQLKINMPSSHVIAQLDFAQNYSCQALEEVQSAYWDNSEQVTLHPVVFYYKSNDGSQEIQHKSCIIISDCMVHNASTVVAFIKEVIIQKVKEICPDVNFLHYWSDSPTSQYRNKTIFYVIAHHKKLFGMSATWNYFEAGHGKGPCDGVGATSKRMADQATKRNIRIQSTGDFYAWASSMESLVEYKFVGKEYCEKIADELKQQTLKPIPGTMNLHSVVGNGDGVVHVRQLSCFCIECYDGNNFEFGCSGWTRQDHFSTDSQVSEATTSKSATE